MSAGASKLTFRNGGYGALDTTLLRPHPALAHAIAGSRHISEGNGKYEGVMNKLRESKEGGRYD